MQYRPLAGLALVAGLLAGPADAGFIGFAERTASVTPRFAATGSPESLVVDLEVPGVVLEEEGEYLLLQLPGHSRRMVAGEPELPMLTASVMLPDTGAARVELEVLEEEELRLDRPLAPSRGHLTRDVPLSEVPRVPGAVYESDAPYPAPEFAAGLGTPYLLRDVRGAALRISPVVYYPQSGRVRVLRKARLHLTAAPSRQAVNPRRRARAGLTREFLPLYESLFLNPPQHIIDPGTEVAGSALIIAHDDWMDSLAPLEAWRAEKGLVSESVPMSQVGSNAADIKSFLQQRYDATDLAFVLLVGDSDTVPTLKGENEGADCDACLAKLEGDDHVPDLFVSRFSAKTTAEVDVQVARAVRYERSPEVGELGAGYGKAIGIASNEGNPTDFERMNVLRDALLADRYTEFTELYDEKGWFADKVKPGEVKDAVEAGAGLIGYMGHGSKTAWVTSKFGVGHARNLGNDKMWPMIWDVACVNGDFVGGGDCFAEAWAKAGTPESPRGAIGMVAASTNMSWVPPTDWQKNIITEYMLPGKAFTGGALHHFGLVKAMEQWGEDADSEGVMMVEQCIYFGDSSVQLRTQQPRHVDVAVEVDEETGAKSLVVTHGDAPVAGAKVVLHRGAMQAVQVTDAAGRCAVPVELREDDGDEPPPPPCTVTVTGPDLVPVLGSVLQM